MVKCLSSVRMNMKADILRQTSHNPALPDPTPGTPNGGWSEYQDPDSGELVRKWEPATKADNPATPTVYEGLESFACIARGIVDGGIRVAGTTENFGDLYENVDFVVMTVPGGLRITKRDRVTNIRNREGIVLWRNEEGSDYPTVFNVKGVTPIPDPWGKYMEQRVMLERAEIQ